MARKDFGAKPYTYPQPVFILATYNEDGTANAMNAAWGGISEGNEISFCISAGHKTTKNFQRTGAFTVSMADAKHVAACDYVGIVSANNVAGRLLQKCEDRCCISRAGGKRVYDSQCVCHGV